MTSKPNTLSAKEIGRRLAVARQNIGLSQAEIAELLGVNQRTVSAYEKGQRRIHAEQLFKYATAVKLSLDQLSGAEQSKFDERTRSAHIIRELQKLPEEDQKFVSGMIDKLTAAAK